MSDRLPLREVDLLDVSSTSDDIFKSMVFIKDNKIKMLEEQLAAKGEEIKRLLFDVGLKTRQHANQSLYIGSLQGMLTDFNEIMEWQEEQLATKDEEIKRLREQISRLGRLAFFAKDEPVEKIINHFVQWGDSTFKYLQELKGQLAAKDNEIERFGSLVDLTAHNFLQLQPGIAWEGGIDNAMKAACEEIKRLQECCEKYGKKVMRQDANLLKVINRNREQRKQITKWQQIAIEERAKATYYLDDWSHFGEDFQLIKWENAKTSIQDHYLEQAAKELGLEQEASYVKRLEEKISDFYECDATRRGCCRQVAQDQARAALAKIREGKE